MVTKVVFSIVLALILWGAAWFARAGADAYGWWFGWAGAAALVAMAFLIDWRGSKRRPR